jgi:hypothetical protein
MKSSSPKLLFVAGVVGVVGTVVLASRATLKLEEVLDEHNETLDKLENMESNNHFVTERDYQQAKLGLYIRTSMKVGKLYAPAIGVGLVAVAALTGSHVILTNRNTALTAAYVAVDKAFKAYRKRVVEELGDDKDREYRYGPRDAEIVEETPEGPVTKMVKKYDNVLPGAYARFFDEANENWERNPDSNIAFLKAQQNYATERLQSRGYLFLNEVYKSLGLKQTRAGQIVGWTLGEGDDYVDFGVFNVNSESARDFVNGWNSRVILDFNVTGPILGCLNDED